MAKKSIPRVCPINKKKSMVPINIFEMRTYEG